MLNPFAHIGLDRQLAGTQFTRVTAPPSNVLATRDPAAIAPIITWDESLGATMYTVKRSPTVDGTYSTLGTTSLLTYTDATAVKGTQYYYKVSASGAGVSADSAAAGVRTWSVLDNCNRADSAVSLGVATTGETYVLRGATNSDAVTMTWGIGGNAARMVTSSVKDGWIHARIPKPAGETISVTLAVIEPVNAGSGMGMIFRSVDRNTLWWVRLAAGGTVGLYKHVAATTATLVGSASFGRGPLAGDVLTIEDNGSLISVYVNGVFQFSVTDTYSAGASNFGYLAWGADGFDGRWDNLRAAA